MAVRPIFLPMLQGSALVRTENVEFQWFPGMSKSQAQKSIRSLHDEAAKRLDIKRILEISSKSPDGAGVNLSAFNLMVRTERRKFSVECAYQASKVFERGGPYADLLGVASIDAKRDPRIKGSGRLLKFRFFGQDWGLEPRTAFYDWIYINALHRQSDLVEIVLNYQAFSDIAFNPEKSINCQAYAAALYVALHARGIITMGSPIDRGEYMRAVNIPSVSNAHIDTTIQNPLF